MAMKMAATLMTINWMYFSDTPFGMLSFSPVQTNHEIIANRGP